MLESMRRGQRWLTLIFVSTIGVVFVFFLGTGGGFGPSTPSGNAVVQVDETRLTQNDLTRERRALEERLRAELGDAYDQLGADKFLDSQALTQLVNQAVLAQAAQDLGLQVTKEELRLVVQGSPIFIDEEGRFDPSRFDTYAQGEFGSQRAFMESFSRSLLGQKLIQLVAGQTTLSDAELDLQTRYELEELQLAYVAFDELQLAAGETVADADVETYASAHEAELRTQFGEREAELSQPERVHARHILIALPSGAGDAELATAREKAQRARDRVLGGEDFAAVAKEMSEDTANAGQGGDLGTFARGLFDRALDDAAFALDAGGLSEVIRSVHGFHVVRVDEKLAAEPAKFEDHRVALAREGATRERATKLAEERSAALAESIRGGQSLEDAARAAELTLERPTGIKRRPDGFVPGLGAAPGLLTKAFVLEAGQSSPEVFDLPEKKVLIQVLARKTLSEAELAAERTMRREQAEVQKQNETLQAWLDDYRTQLERSGRLLISAERALGEG